MGAVTTAWARGGDGRPVPRVANVDYLLTPQLHVLGVYQKHHLVPFGEYVPLHDLLPFVGQLVPSFAPSIPGTELTVLEFRPTAGTATTTATPTPTTTTTATTSSAPPPQPPPADPVRLAPMICFDAIFPEINVSFARADPEPEILVNPTNDAWYGYSSGPYQFLAIVQLRAIEAGKAVVRPAYAGVSAAILPTGELAPGAIEIGPVDPDLAPDPYEPPRLLLAEVPRLRGGTLYTRVGDLFAYGCAAFAGLSLVAGWRAGRHRRARA
jgi:apolipoprotein N-acyltransferase